MGTLLSAAAGWIAAIIAALFYFHKAKSAAVEKQKAEDVQKDAERVVAETKVAAAQETKVIQAASNAKSESNDLSDSDLRDRMRTRYTKP